jgi:hypothetical protein
MLRKAIFALLAVAVICLAATTGVSARGGGGGDYPTAVGYPYPFSFGSGRICHPVRRRVLMRYGFLSRSNLRLGRPDASRISAKVIFCQLSDIAYDAADLRDCEVAQDWG